MARADYWQNVNGTNTGAVGWLPFVVDVADLNPGETLVRTRIDLQLQGYDDNDQDPDGYPFPWLQSQMVAALCWSTTEGPPGYYDTALFDWIWVRQVAFEATPFLLPPDYDTQAIIYQNTAETRVVDTHSMRKTDPVGGGSLYLVLDWAPTIPALNEFLTPDLSWVARVLAKVAAS